MPGSRKLPVSRRMSQVGGFVREEEVGTEDCWSSAVGVRGLSLVCLWIFLVLFLTSPENKLLVQMDYKSL